ncbi:MAG TPA: zinc ribbon domain-containing protein [Candidatus Kapabacteria bacterium]|nr:zinc ribbon domain-containing protein [Candidatus Kapabacteria bacterium]
MPIYNYKCDTCKKNFEIKQSINDKPLEICPDPNCKDQDGERGKIHRVISKNIGLVFQGSGFYITDYANSHTKSPTATNNHNTNVSEKPNSAVAS